MKTVWKRGLDDQNKKDIEEAFKNGKRLRARLEEILQSKYEERDRLSIAEDAYESPSWAYKQADSAGYKRAIKEILALLEE